MLLLIRWVLGSNPFATIKSRTPILFQQFPYASMVLVLVLVQLLRGQLLRTKRAPDDNGRDVGSIELDRSRGEQAGSFSCGAFLRSYVVAVTNRWCRAKPNGPFDGKDDG